ncbi:MAG: hypothetical protein HY043_14405 [Verrucomicrobia bacterium]|nr:hypothetical protein [Verrucomicrobiota bacterium]
MRKTPLKILTVSLTALLAAAGQLSAQTVNWGAQNANGVGVADGNSQLPAGVLVRVGSFSISDATIQANQGNFSFLNSQFTQYGSATIGQGFGGFSGHWAASSSGPTQSGPNIAGLQIYIWAFNNASASSATEQGIFYMNKANLSTWQFPVETPVPGTTSIDLADLTTGANNSSLATGATMVLGGFNVGSGTSFFGSPLFDLVPVPEPSAYAAVFGTLCLACVIARKKILWR